jgi:hypothetical protein
LAWAPGSLVRRLRSAGVYAAISSLPFTIFLLRNRAGSGAVTDRTIDWHPLGMDHLTDALMAISSWFLPWRGMGVRSGLIILSMSVALSILCYRMSRHPEVTIKSERSAFDAFYTSTMLFIVLYVLHLFVSISTANYSTPLDSRILAPVLVALICLMATAPTVLPRGLWKSAAMSMSLALIVLSSLRAAGWVAYDRQHELGYLAPNWMESKSAMAIRNLPPNAVVYSNRIEQIYFSLRRPALPIPFKRDPLSLKVNSDLELETSKMRAQLESTGGLLIYMHEPKLDAGNSKNGAIDPPSWDAAHEYTVAELQQVLPLTRIDEDETSDVFAITGQPASIK